MKAHRFILFAMLTAACTLVGCDEDAYIKGPGDNSNNQDTLEIVKADTTGIEISIDSITKLAQTLEVGVPTSEYYKFACEITSNLTTPTDVPSKNTNINFSVKDSEGKIIGCYYMNGLNNRPFKKSADVPRVGTKLVVIGKVELFQNGSGALIPEVCNGFIVRYDSLVAPLPFPGCPEPTEGQISVSQANTIALALADKGVTTEYYDVVGVVTDVDNVNTQYRNATFTMSDGKKTLLAYRIGKNSKIGTITAANQVQSGDTIVVHTQLQNWGGIAETKNGSITSTTNKN